MHLHTKAMPKHVVFSPHHSLPLELGTPGHPSVSILLPNMQPGKYHTENLISVFRYFDLSKMPSDDKVRFNLQKKG